MSSTSTSEESDDGNDDRAGTTGDDNFLLASYLDKNRFRFVVLCIHEFLFHLIYYFHYFCRLKILLSCRFIPGRGAGRKPITRGGRNYTRAPRGRKSRGGYSGGNCDLVSFM